MNMIIEHSFYEFNPLWRTALQSIEQVMLSAIFTIDRWIGTHVIFLFAKHARDKPHEPAAHPYAALGGMLRPSFPFDLRHRTDIQTHMHRELHFGEFLQIDIPIPSPLGGILSRE